MSTGTLQLTSFSVNTGTLQLTSFSMNTGTLQLTSFSMITCTLQFTSKYELKYMYIIGNLMHVSVNMLNEL